MPTIKTPETHDFPGLSHRVIQKWLLLVTVICNREICIKVCGAATPARMSHIPSFPSLAARISSRPCKKSPGSLRFRSDPGRVRRDLGKVRGTGLTTRHPGARTLLLRITLSRKKEMHMGEVVEFPQRREGCSRWRPGQAAISLIARPTCAALAAAVRSTRPTLKA